MAFRSITVDLVSGFPTGYIIVALYDPTAPSTPVAYQSFARPGQNPGEVIFNGVNDIVYEVRIYQNTTSAVGGTLLRSYVMDEKYYTGSSREDLYLTAGLTTGMTIGGNSYSISGGAFIDNTLVGWTYTLERVGAGTLEVGIDYTIDGTTNGWVLTDPSYKFGDGERYVMHFLAIIVSAPAPNSQSAGVLFQNTIVVTVDTTLDPNTHFGNFVLLQGTNPILNITLPASNTVPNGKMVCLMSEGGSHISAKVATSDSTAFSFLKQSPTSLNMGQGETIWVYFDGTNWIVPMKDGNWNSVGELVPHYATTELNVLQCNGQKISKTTYARLWNFVNTQMASSQLVPYTTWNYTNPVTGRHDSHGKYADNGDDYFYLPILYAEKDGSGNIVGASGFLRGVQGGTGNRNPGDQEYDAVGNFSANLSGPTFGLATANNPANAVIVLGKPAGSSLNTPSVPSGNLVSPNPIDFVGQTKSASGFTQNNETRPADTGIFWLVRY